MSKKPTAIPPGYHSITPYLFVNEATKAIEYYKKSVWRRGGNAHGNAGR